MGSISRRRFGGVVGATGTGALASLASGWVPANAAVEEPFRARGRRPARPAEHARHPRRRPRLGRPVLLRRAGDPHAEPRSAGRARACASPTATRRRRSCSPTRFGLYTGRYPGRLPGGLHGADRRAQRRSTASRSTTRHWRRCSRAPGYDDGADRQVALRLPAVVQPDAARLGRVLRQLQRRPRLLLQARPTGALRPLRGRGRVPGPALLHRDHHRAGRPSSSAATTTGPWLLNLNFTTPHWPWEGPGDKAVSDELTARIRAGEPRRTVPQRRRLAGDLPGDGRGPRPLDRQGDRARCGAAASSTTRWSSSPATTAASASPTTWPFSGGKGERARGRHPRLDDPAAGRAQLRPRQVSDEPVVTMDWTATLLELAGAEPDPAYPLDGVSLVATCSRRTGAAARPVLADERPAGAAPRRPQVRAAHRRRRPPLRPRRRRRASRPTWRTKRPATSPPLRPHGRRSTRRSCRIHEVTPPAPWCGGGPGPGRPVPSPPVPG